MGVSDLILRARGPPEGGDQQPFIHVNIKT